MISSSDRHGNYLKDFDVFQKRTKAEDPSWLRELRREAIARFEEFGFPTGGRGNESWKYTSVGSIAKAGFRYAFQRSNVSMDSVSAHVLDGKWTLLVFVDGHYSATLSKTNGAGSDVYVDNLAVAACGAKSVATHFGQIGGLNGDAFTALSNAFVKDGAFVSLAPGAVSVQPIHILHVRTGNTENTVAYPRTLIVAGAGSVARIVESFVGFSDTSSFTNAVTEIVLEEGARIERYKVTLEGASAHQVATTEVAQSKDSCFTSVVLCAGGLMVRDNLNVRLNGTGSEAILNGLSFTSGTQHVDHATFVDHATSNTKSHQVYKAILEGKSRAVFSGRVLVRGQAQKSDARQVNNNLLLSDGAEVDTKPFLEIFADDVKCTHGATAGKLDDEALFYMHSRGLDDRGAKDLLAFGFAREVMDRINLPPVRRQIENILLRSLPDRHKGPTRGGTLT